MSTGARPIERQIVDFVLDYVERAGKFEGRGKGRRLMLGGLIVNLKTGESRDIVDDMAQQVRMLMSGEATYKAVTPPASGKEGKGDGV